MAAHRRDYGRDRDAPVPETAPPRGRRCLGRDVIAAFGGRPPEPEPPPAPAAILKVPPGRALRGRGRPLPPKGASVDAERARRMCGGLSYFYFDPMESLRGPQAARREARFLPYQQMRPT